MTLVLTYLSPRLSTVFGRRHWSILTDDKLILNWLLRFILVLKTRSLGVTIWNRWELPGVSRGWISALFVIYPWWLLLWSSLNIAISLLSWIKPASRNYVHQSRNERLLEENDAGFRGFGRRQLFVESPAFGRLPWQHLRATARPYRGSTEIW